MCYIFLVTNHCNKDTTLCEYTCGIELCEESCNSQVNQQKELSTQCTVQTMGQWSMEPCWYLCSLSEPNTSPPTHSRKINWSWHCLRKMYYSQWEESLCKRLRYFPPMCISYFLHKRGVSYYNMSSFSFHTQSILVSKSMLTCWNDYLVLQRYLLTRHAVGHIFSHLNVCSCELCPL